MLQREGPGSAAVARIGRGGRVAAAERVAKAGIADGAGPSLSAKRLELPVPGSGAPAAAGSHTSMLIAESLLGRSVAATRQNAGRSAYGAGGPPRPLPVAGGTNAPAATSWASVTVPLRNAIVDSVSHAAAAATGGVTSSSASRRPTTRSTLLPIASDRAIRARKHESAKDARYGSFRVVRVFAARIINDRYSTTIN